MAAKPKGLPRTPAKVGPSTDSVTAGQLRTARRVLSEKATGPRIEQVRDEKGNLRYEYGVEGRSAFDAMEEVPAINLVGFGRNQQANAILKAAEMPSPDFEQRQKAMRARKGIASGDQPTKPIDQVMSDRIGEVASGSPPSNYMVNKVIQPQGVSTTKSQPTEEQPKAVPTKTVETMPKIDGPMRSISSGNTSIFDTMPKAEIGKDRAIGEFSSGASAMKEQAPAAMSEDRIQSLYKKATGTSFNPKSRADRAALAEIQAVMNARPDLANASDTKIALAWYKSKKK